MIDLIFSIPLDLMTLGPVHRVFFLALKAKLTARGIFWLTYAVVLATDLAQSSILKPRIRLVYSRPILTHPQISIAACAVRALCC